ncbi:MAG: DNA polymerase III subunit alpha [Nitrospinota bacterium]|nr:DNA polymerase III subunit alpha [Nitrospinota bacterium]
MAHEDFVHLHLHSEYSLLDGAIQFPDLLKKAEEFNMPAVAVTDHGNLFGAIDFYQKGFKSPVKPIIGCEVYVASGSRHDKTSNENPDDDISHHLILLVKNLEGYKNLCKLSSAGYTEGFYYKPRIDKELLAQHNQGLIAMSACLKGEVARKLLSNKQEEAEKAAGFYKELFGDRYYLEIQDHGIPEQKMVNPQIVELAKKIGTKVVATNDAHYLQKEHSHAHDALLCIGTGKILSDEKRMRFSSQEFYFKSAEEMRKLFAWIPEAITNTREVAERCNLDLHLGQYHLPEYTVPSDYSSPQKYLDDLVSHNLEIRLHEKEKKEGKLDEKTVQMYRERLKLELGVINNMNFAGYFLITWDFIQFAFKNKIPVGPGRGSAAGSLVAYSLSITDIDPIKYGLLFERFLNPERISMPDIDIDFCMERRDEVIKYVSDKYGEKSVAQIITFGTMKARAVLRDVGRVMDMGYSDVDRIAKLIPETLNITIKEAIKTEPRLADLIKKDPRVKELMETAEVLEGVSRHASTHAAGVVIAPSELTEYLPLYRTNKGDVVTQYPMNNCEDLGLLKMDFLGLRTLTVIDWTEKKIKSKKDPAFSIKSIPMDDKKTFKLLSEAKTLGIFQLESSGMRDILRKLKPENFTDIIALVALYRPGPIGSGMIDSFIRRKHGTEKTENILPQMTEALAETYGVIVYQEQVMKLANVLAGFTMGEADTLRKAMGKKKMDVMENMREKFMEGAKKAKINEKKAGEVFDLMYKFAEYGFNKSHSAAYALLSYQTAYLKAHYPHEFMSSMLTSEMDNTAKVVLYRNECKDMGIDIRPPDVNLSGEYYYVDGNDIIFCMAGIKNVGLGAVREIIRARNENGHFKTVVDFAKAVDTKLINKRAFESLVKCGAFDSLHPNRAAIFEAIDNLFDESAKARNDKTSGQKSMFDQLETEQEETLRLVPDKNPWPERDKLSYEKEMVGFYITGHPLEPFQKDIKHLATHFVTDLADTPSKREVRLCGVVSSLRTQLTKKKKLMAYVTLEDLTGSISVIIWPELLEKSHSLLESNDPVFLVGQLDAGENETKMIASEIISLKEAKTKFTNTIHLKINMVGLEEKLLEEIRSVAKKHRGKSTLTLHFTFPDKKRVFVNASDKYGVTADDKFLDEIETILGPNSVYCS